ncbi:MAG TPA: methyl-accepting chemotaxis protein [Noviherbaspirillum sp.]|nr:methyl-accepting chemotaxis protein [Noviherbaspirillum sp.]
MKLANVKIGGRLAIGFGSVAILSLILGITAYMELDEVNDQWTRFNATSLAKETEITQARTALGEGIQNFKNYIVRAKDYDQRFNKDMGAIEDSAKKYEATGEITATEKEALEKIRQGVDVYRGAMKKAIAMKQAGSSIEEIDKSIKGADTVIKEALNELREATKQETQDTSKALTNLIQNGKTIAATGGTLIVLLTISLAFMTSRSITLPLAEAVRTARTVATGDLTQKIRVDRKDEAGELLQALSDMNTNLARIVGEVRAGTESIAAASAQITNGNQDLSSRTEELASSLEETASSMEELTSAVRQNSENARSANALAASASDVAVRGGAVVSEVVLTMNGITEASRKIVDIISVIDSIAFQTNILALNAAVEAARAGEQGRGFAVVASEVRTLAQRSASAAKEIKELIQNSVDKVEAGNRLVDNAGATMNDIVKSVTQVSGIIADIMSASDEQRSGIEQISVAITQIDEATQQSAALVEQTAAASDAMKNQAASLARAVLTFKLDSPEESSQQAAATPAKSMPTSKGALLAARVSTGRSHLALS